MAVERDRPYMQFNFLVDLGGGEARSIEAGFDECGPLSSEVAVVEYRNGNEPTNAPRKLTGLTRVADLTLRRGVVGSTALWQWLRQVQDGDQAALRTVTVSLLDEGRDSVVLTWRLHNARPTRWTIEPLSARRSEVAVEELVLAYERLDVE